MLNLNELKLSEVAEIERLSGQPLSNLAEDGVPRGKLMQAIVYTIKRRETKRFSFEDAGEVSFDEAMTLIVGDANDDKSDADSGEG